MNTRRSSGKDPANTGQSPETEDATPESSGDAKVPVIEIKPSKMTHDYLTALAGGTMGKNPTAVATFLLTREIQRLIEAKHVPGLWL